jgi:transposase-like protein
MPGHPMDDLARFCCQNPDCTLYGRRDAGNLSVCGRLGKSKQFRQLYCNGCRARFSERKGTPLYRCHLPEEKAHAVLEHLDEGCGIRPTGRLVGVHRDTVVRLARAAGQHAHDAHDELVAFSPSDPRGPVRREVVVRRQGAEELRPDRPGR